MLKYLGQEEMDSLSTIFLIPHKKHYVYVSLTAALGSVLPVQQGAVVALGHGLSHLVIVGLLLQGGHEVHLHHAVSAPGPGCHAPPTAPHPTQSISQAQVHGPVGEGGGEGKREGYTEEMEDRDGEK